MRILLDAYFDNNFGDDLFVSTILQRYPEDIFYVFWNNGHEGVLQKAMGYSNIVILPRQCELRTGTSFDGYIMIGGDVLPDGVDYTARISGMQAVKAQGGFVAMLGFSLYESYGEKTREDLRTMAALADSIVVRDRYSAERFRTLVPGARVVESTDMAFTASYGVHTPGESAVLGIAPRRKLYSTDEEHFAFCAAMAAVADGWIRNHPDGIVRFLALSTGEYDDRVTAKDIQSMMAEKDRTEIVAHTDGVAAFLESVAECDAMVPTRFHALVFALIYRIPFVPVPYEVKLTQLLDEIGYSGVRIPYGASVSADMVSQAVQELDQNLVDLEAAKRYQSKAEVFFQDADRLAAESRSRVRRESAVVKCAKAEENARLLEENNLLKAQVAELEKWVQSLQKERNAFDEALRDLNEKYTALYEKSTPIKSMIKRAIKKMPGNGQNEK